MSENEPYDVVIAGGGPAGLNAALALGRARKRVLLCDAGVRRNAKAQAIHNFVTRDGIAPDEFRRVGREQLKPYPSVELREVRIEEVTGARSAFRVRAGGETVSARRLLLCTGLIDELLPLEGYRELWGHAVFQCPYCHGWELRDRRWGYLPRPTDGAHAVAFALQLRAWSREVTVFTNAAFEVSQPDLALLESGGVRIEPRPIARLVREGERLHCVELRDGTRLETDVLFSHPPQRQCPLVSSLGLALDSDGFVKIEPMRHETSVPGVYAAGDLTTRGQGAIFAAAAGMQAAAMINVELTIELATSGAL